MKSHTLYVAADGERYAGDVAVAGRQPCRIEVPQRAEEPRLPTWAEVGRVFDGRPDPWVMLPTKTYQRTTVHVETIEAYADSRFLMLDQPADLRLLIAVLQAELDGLETRSPQE